MTPLYVPSQITFSWQCPPRKWLYLLLPQPAERIGPVLQGPDQNEPLHFSELLRCFVNAPTGTPQIWRVVITIVYESIISHCRPIHFSSPHEPNSVTAHHRFPTITPAVSSLHSLFTIWKSSILKYFHVHFYSILESNHFPYLVWGFTLTLMT